MPPKKGSRKPPPSSSTHQDPPEGLPQKFSELTISDDNDALMSPTSPPAASTKPVMLSPQKKPNKKKEELVIVDSWEDDVSDVSDGSEGDVVVVGPRGGKRWDDDSVDELDDEDWGKDSYTNPNTKVTSKSFSSPPLPPAPPPNTKASSLGSSASSSRKATPAPGGSPSWDSDLPLFTSPPSEMKPPYAAGEPEKRRQPTTDAVARRLIANALGIRAPKSTVEQKEYEASMKAQLRKKREKEKEEREVRKKEEEEVERRRREVWGD